MTGRTSVLLCLLLVLLVTAGCEDGLTGVSPTRSAEPPRPTAPPNPQVLSASEEAARPRGFVGVVLAAETADLAFDFRGRLTQVSVRPGDRVQRGMALATIEPLDLKEQLVSAQAAVEMARSGVSQAQTALRLAKERVSRLQSAPEVFSAEERSLAAGNVETTEKDLETARSRVVQAESELRTLRNQSYRRVLRASTDGWVAARLLDPGALVEPGQPVVRLKRNDRFLLRFAVPPTEAAQWTPGKPIRWRPDDSERLFRAEVARIAQQVDMPSQMVFVEADLEPSGLLRDGLVVRVEP